MKKKNFSETQIVSILRQQEAGKTVSEICREHGNSDAKFFITGKQSTAEWR